MLTLADQTVLYKGNVIITAFNDSKTDDSMCFSSIVAQQNSQSFENVLLNFYLCSNISGKGHIQLQVYYDTNLSHEFTYNEAILRANKKNQFTLKCTDCRLNEFYASENILQSRLKITSSNNSILIN